MPRSKPQGASPPHEDALPLGATATIAAVEETPAASSQRDDTHKRPGVSVLWRTVGKRFAQTARRTRMPAAGLTLVGGEMSSASSSSALSTTFDDVVQTEGVASRLAGQQSTHIWLFQPNQDPLEIGTDDIAAALAQDKSFLWIDLASYQEADLTTLAMTLGLHRGVLRTILSPWHRPSLSVYPEHMYMSATIARLDAEHYRVQASELDIIMGHHFLLTAHKQALPFMQRLVARTQQTPELVQSDAAFLLYLLLDELLSDYEEVNRLVQSESELIEERALRDSSDAFLEDLLRFKRYAFAVSQLVDQHREVFAAFFRPDFTWISGEDIEEYFRDLQARLAHLLAMLLVAKEAVNSAFNIYVSQMSHRTNQIIKVLTMVSTVLLPATLIIALFGANIQGIMPHYGSIWFIIMMLCIVGIIGGTLYVFNRQNWINLQLGPQSSLKRK